MTPDRFVVLGLAPARSAWFRAVAQWANTAAVPADFVKCVSVEELRARLASTRTFSALIADAGLSAVDRDLVAAAADAGCPVIVVADARVRRDWQALGAAALLPPGFSREQLLDALRQHARPIARADLPPALEPVDWGEGHASTARVAAVCGSGGTGASTVAIGLAQGLADTAPPGSVLLVDFARNAEQAMLHDARDLVPGVQELVEAHRVGRPSADEVRSLTIGFLERGYDLLLGLRRARFWPSLRPRAFEAGFTSLRGAYRVIVCDTDSDVEGEDVGGSIDVEERNVMARTALLDADVVYAVGLPTMKGLHSLGRVVHDLVAAGVPAARLVPVLNRSTRNPRRRAALAGGLAQLTSPALGEGLAAPVFLPERRAEEALRDGVRLPSVLTGPLAGAFAAVEARAARPASVEPLPVRPGSLGSWTG